jgi:hypothetical protein
MKKLLTLIALTLTLSSCANYSLTSNHAEVNQLIANANTARFTSFAAGMVACNDNAACQVGLAMGFSANLGQQAFYKPETTSDLLHAFLPYATLGVDVARLWRMAPTNGDSSGGFIITGDNNQLNGWNRLTADNQSTLTGSFDTTNAIEHLVYNQANSDKANNGSGQVSNQDDHSDNSTNP